MQTNVNERFGMSRGVSARRGRCLLVVAAATFVAAVLEWWLLLGVADAFRAARPLGFQAVLVAACEVIAMACAGWLWLLVTLVARDAARGRAPSRAPAAVRRLVLAACGLSLAGGLLAPAQATGVDPAAPAAELLVGLPLPDRMTTAQWLGRAVHGTREPRAAARPSPRPDPDIAVVRPGDSLWRIAARTLPPDADAAAIDRRWRRIYDANRALIGPDPDQIRPGQRLLLPPVHPAP